MAISYPPELVAFTEDDAIQNVACATWIPPFVGPQPCDFLVAFVQSESHDPGPCEYEVGDDFTPDSGAWVEQFTIRTEDSFDCSCDITLGCWTKMVETPQVSGLSICSEWECDLSCKIISVWRFTGVDSATPVVQILGLGDCPHPGCDVMVNPGNVDPPFPIDPTGTIAISGSAIGMCENYFPSWGGGDDFWNPQAQFDVCTPHINPSSNSQFIQTAQWDMSGSPFPAMVYVGATPTCLAKLASVATGTIVLKPGDCSFTPPVIGDTAHGGSLSQHPVMPPTLTGRGRIGITSTSSYSIDSSRRPEELDAEDAAQVMDFW